MGFQKKIIIVGGGFGGVYACFYLQKYLRGMKHRPSVTLVSKEDYFLFTPLLHEVVAGSVHPSNIIQPIRKILNTAISDLFVAEASKVNLGQKTVITSRGNLSYDYLVLAAGAETRMYNFPEKTVFKLKNLHDAARLKNRIIEMFDEASKTYDFSLRKRLLTFVVIGGGPTGVELVAEMHEFVHGTLSLRYPRVRKEEVSLYLVHAQKELLGGFDAFIRIKANQVLREKNKIKILFNTLVDDITPDEVRLDNGDRIATATPILVAGIAPVEMKFSPQIYSDPSGQIPVNNFLQLPKNQNVFVIGDLARVVDARSGRKVPQTAQAAVAEAKVAAENIAAMLRRKNLREFMYKEKGQLVSLGRWNAAAQIYGLKFSGSLAWWIWRTVYASKLVGWRNRIWVVINWTIGVLQARDISKL